MSADSPDKRYGLHKLRNTLWKAVHDDDVSDKAPEELREVTSEGWVLRTTLGNNYPDHRHFCWLDGHGYKGLTEGTRWKSAALRMVASIDELIPTLRSEE